MTVEECEFETERLIVNEWHSFASSDWQEQDLAHVVAAMLTENVTGGLPAPWQGSYTAKRARKWVAERDEEGTTLLVVDRATQQAVGLMILFEERTDGNGGDTDARLGYLLSEDWWGKGLASELVTGFVDWCRNESSISSISGGVASDNLASIRVLEKNGFLPVERIIEALGDEQLYRLILRDSD